MELSTYGRIGKSPFIKAIGIQRNYKKIEYYTTTELDLEKSGCFSCNNYHIMSLPNLAENVKSTCMTTCKQCPNAVKKAITHEKISYINEKNKFGYKPRLQAIALKLLLLYHFMQPDENGIIRDVCEKELANKINCSIRSVKNANLTLSKYGYISFAHSGSRKNHLHILLTEYKTYSLTAEEGGRGYATFSQESLHEYLKMKDVNQLRILLRIGLDLDTDRNTDKELIVSRDYDSLRRFLPKYCKPGIIQKALSLANEMFTSIFIDDSVIIKMNKTFHGRRKYEADAAKYTADLKSFYSSIDDQIYKLNQNILNHKPLNKSDLNTLTHHGFDKMQGNHTQFYVGLKFNQFDFEQLGIIAATYSVDLVKSSVKLLYDRYLSKLENVRNKPALIRTILKDRLKYDEIARLFEPATM